MNYLICIILVLPLISGYHYYSSFPRLPTPPLVPLAGTRNRQLSSVYEASTLTFTFPSDEELYATLADGRYKLDGILPVDVEAFYPVFGDVQVYMTIPRFDRGSPYSLALLRDLEYPESTHLEAFPTYAWHSSYGANCDGLTSAFRIEIDQCGRMWILDSGEINQIQLCQPQVVVLDLINQNEVHRYRLPEDVFTRNLSRLVTITVDVTDPPPRGYCHQAFVYIADPLSYAIIVYDVVKQKSWRIENAYTHNDPRFNKFTIAGESFELMDGVFGLSVTPRNLGLRRMLYFHALNSDRQVAVPLDVINNATNFKSNAKSSLDKFVELGHRGTQCVVSAMTHQGYLLCGFIKPLALVAWDIRKPYITENRIVLAENRKTLQFVGGLKVVQNRRGQQEVWMLSNRAQKFFAETTNFSEINYRIQKCGLDELLLNRQC